MMASRSGHHGGQRDVETVQGESGHAGEDERIAGQLKGCAPDAAAVAAVARQYPARRAR